MKDKLIHDIELKLSMSCPEMDRESLYKRGMDIHEIQKLMGHSNVQTTLEYIYTDDSQVRNAYEKYAA